MSSFATKAEAEDFGRRTLLRMNNPHDWTVRVWDNLGWHVELRDKKLRQIVVHVSRYSDKKITFWSWMVDKPDCVGSSASWPCSEHMKSPQGAVDQLFRRFDAYITQQITLFEQLREVVRVVGRRNKKAKA